MSDLREALNGAPLAVDVAAIERSLAELWRQEGLGSETAVTRAALWNVVTVVRDDGARQFAREVLAQVSEVVPQRALLIQTDRNSEDGLSAWISAHCHLVGGESQMCSEEITIVAGGRGADGVPSLVRALLLPDMPVAGWWPQGLPSGELEELTIATADLLIVDSRSFDGVDDLHRASVFGSHLRRGVTDLEWMRIEEWRRATALAFDNPQLRARIRGMKSLRIQYGEARRFAGRAGALLYAGWVLGQLRKLDPGAKIGIELVPVEGEEAAGKLLSIDIDLGEASGIEVVRCEGAVRAFPRGIDGAAPAVVRLFSPDSDHLVRRALAHGERDAICERALAGAADVLGRIG